MFDPFDGGTQEAFKGNRFSSGQAEGQASAYEMLDAGLSYGAQATAAKRAARYRKKQLKEDRNFQMEMMDRQARLARRAARPSSGQRVASGIGTAASAVGAIGSAVSIAAAI
jgi:hypothetical protein